MASRLHVATSIHIVGHTPSETYSTKSAMSAEYQAIIIIFAFLIMYDYGTMGFSVGQQKKKNNFHRHFDQML